MDYKKYYKEIKEELVEKEMHRFLGWFNNNDKTDFVIKAAIAHLWIVTIHPFEDANGRIARALTDMLQN